jgi:hypothetical protein
MAKAQDVIAALRKRYPDPAWAFLEQVANGTGSNQSRWADAIAMSLWPSRGIELHGIEVKVSRSDWLSELNNPAKADAFQRYCHRWWLAIGDEKIVQPGELPPTWGLLVLKGDTIRCKTEATAAEPKPIDVVFLAGILRNVAKLDTEAVNKARNEGYADGYANAKKNLEHSDKNVEGQLKEIRQSLLEFETASGLHVNKYNGKRMGEAVKALEVMRNKRYSLQGAKDACAVVADGLTQLDQLFGDIKDV